MKIGKISNLVDNNKRDFSELVDLVRHLDSVDTDIENIILLLSGRVRFGTGTDGDRGENISGEFQTITTNATPDTEDTLAHTLGSIPTGFIVLHQDKAGSLYQGPTTGTNWTSSNIYVKCNVASVTFLIFLLK